MKNTTCIICSKEFEPREGKLYCSDSCRQKAYEIKKSKSIAGTEKSETQTSEKIKYRISFSEYEKYLSLLDERGKESRKKEFNIIIYSFFRKNLVGITDIETIYKYIDEFFNVTDNDMLVILKCNGLNYDLELANMVNMLEKYFEFEKLYHAGYVEIIS